jgi:hypothetical protein
VASVISHFAPKTVESYSTPLQNDTGHNGIFRIPPLLLKLAPFLVRKSGHRPGGYGNAVEDYWPQPGRSLMQAHLYLSWLSNIKALKLVKAVAGLEK